MDPESAVDLDDCDRDQIEACLAAPRAGYGGVDKYPSVSLKAAALLYSLVKGHACTNGNKRLALVVTVAFLAKNDWWLWANPDRVREKVEEIAASDPTKPDQVRADLGAWMEEHLVTATEAAVRLQAHLMPGQE